MTEYTVKNGIIHTKNGLPYAPRWFCDGRVAFQAYDGEIGDIDYFNPDSEGQYIAFHKRFWGGMRLFLKSENTARSVRAAACEIWPFGYFSQGEDCDYGLYTADDVIYLTVMPKADYSSISLEFYDEYKLLTELTPYSDIRYKGAKERKWDELSCKDGVIMWGFCEGDAKTAITISSNKTLTLRSTPKNTKYIISTASVKTGEEIVIAVAFSAVSKIQYDGYQTKLQLQKERYSRVAQRAPVLHSPYVSLNRFFELAPLYHESLKTKDVEGAVRSQSTHYWVWGWDSMTSNESSIYWGDRDFIGNMLTCMRQHSDPRYGLPHAFTNRMGCAGEAAPPAQGMYLTLLHLYQTAGGDARIHYSFAKEIFQTILATEVGNTGLCEGISLYPDFRALIHEDDRTVSAFNNTVCYCAAKAMEELATAYGDGETKTQAAAFAERMKTSFEKTLFNEELGFWDSSAGSKDHQQRGVPSNNAIKWENNFCRDLVAARAEESLAFYEKHLVCKAGIRPLPVWSDCYNADANQLSCWWPVMSEYYTRLLNQFDRTKGIEQFIGWISYWTERLMCPEGISCYDDTAEVPFDEWNCMPGIWHAYSIRGFYNAVIHSVIGLDFDSEGIRFYPYSGREMQIDRLHFGDKIFCVAMKGSGTGIANVVLNGEDLGGVSMIPWDRLLDSNTISVYRTGNVEKGNYDAKT